MEFKKFTLECHRLSDQFDCDYLGVFNIMKSNKTLECVALKYADRFEHFEWSVFGDDDTVQEGVLFKSPASSNLHFSANLSSQKNYFVLLCQLDNDDVVKSRTWEFIQGVTLYPTQETAPFQNKSPQRDTPQCAFDCNECESIPPTLSMNSMNSMWSYNTAFDVYDDETLATPRTWSCDTVYDMNGDDPVGWGSPIPTDSLFDGELILPEYPQLPQSPIVSSNQKNTDCLPSNESNIVDKSDSVKELDDLLKELEMLPIGRPYEHTTNTIEFEDWEVELNKIIAEMNEPFLNIKNIEIESKQPLGLLPSFNSIIIDNYCVTKETDCANLIPIPPPLPPQMFTRHCVMKSLATSQEFKEEVRKVRNRVMGRKNDLKKIQRKGWFSFFK